MNNFIASVLNSPTVSSSKDLAQYLADHADKPEMLRFYIYIGVGTVAAILVQRLTKSVVKKALPKSSPDVVSKVTEAIRTPLSLLIFSYFFIVGFDAITGMPHELWMHVHENLYPIFNGLLVLVSAFRFVDLIAQLLRQRWQSETAHLDQRWADLIGLFGKTIVSLGAGLFIIEKIDPTFNIIPLLTGASFVGAAVALASQNTIANAIGSMEIMIDRLFKEGDRISFDQYDGFVIRMGLRSITLAALTGEKINLPNKDLVDKQIRNYTRGKFNRTTIAVGIRYDHTRTEIERAIAAMDKAVRAHSLVDQCETSLSRFTDNYLELQSIFWADYQNALDYKKLVGEIQLEIKGAFDQERISFAFPGQTVYFEKQAVPASK